ncbi:MAG TPA: fibronectin type III domain-containing protein [Polyangiaceae bacterium]|jgi:hypothetical protein
MTKRLNRIVVIVRRKSNPLEFAFQAQTYCDRMDGNPYFPNPVPPIADVRDAIAKLREAQAATLTRARGTVAVRDQALITLIGLVEAMRALVEKVANENPDVGVVIVVQMTMEVKKERSPSKPPFAVHQGNVSGSVRLAVRAVAKDATYGWAWSADDGATWNEVGPTKQAETKIAGLTPAETYWFRFRGTTPKGTSDWSEPVSFLVK